MRRHVRGLKAWTQLQGRFAVPGGNCLCPDGSAVGAMSKVSSPGVITLAEKYDSGWHMLFDGTPLKLEQSNIGLPTFAVSDAGTITLLHDGTKRRALVSIEFISLLTVIVLALPAGRRRREIDIEELA